MRKSLVIYDLDGTLIDSELTVSRIDAESLTKVGLPVSTAQVHCQMRGLSSKDKFIAACNLIGQPQDEERLTTYKSLRRKRIDALYDDPSITVHEGVHMTLRILQGQKRSLCVASNNNQDRARHAIKKFGLSRYFNGYVYTSDQVAKPKPAPDLFLFAATSMGCSPGESIVIGDAKTDAEGARSAGMDCAIFTGGQHSDSAQKQLRDAGATIILPSHKQLLLHIDGPRA